MARLFQLPKLIATTAVAISACCPTVSLGQGGVGTDDIVGLKIGMAPQEALTMLPKLNPKFKITQLKDTGFNSFKHALVIEAREMGELIVLKFTETQPKAWLIARSIVFPRGQRPLKDELEKQLSAKYGANPTRKDEGTVTRVMRWEWTPQGKAKSLGSGSTCPKPITSGKAWHLAGAPGLYQPQFSRQCGKVIMATFGGSDMSSRTDTAMGLSVVITDMALALRDPMNPLDTAAIRERQQIEGLRKVQPPKL
jgi:hypothetical protein